MNVHLAQVNIARMKGPLESPVMAEFVARLDEINALADGSPGFVWRLQTSEGTRRTCVPTTTTGFSLTCRCGARSTICASALWWVPTGHLPSVDEAKKRLAHLAAHGPTPFAFTFKATFPPDEATLQGSNWSAFAPCPAGSQGGVV